MLEELHVLSDHREIQTNLKMENLKRTALQE